MVEREEESVAVAEPVGHFGIDIIESVVRGASAGADYLVEQEGVHSSSAYGECGLFASERAFEVQFVAEQSGGYRAVEAFCIAVIGADIDDA